MSQNTRALTCTLLLIALSLGACSDKKKAATPEPGPSGEAVTPSAQPKHDIAREPDPAPKAAAASDDLKGTYSFTVKGGETPEADETLVSTLAISAASASALTFKMTLSMDNGHMCEMDGPAKAVAGKPGVFEYREEKPDEDLKCTLRLTVTPEAIEVLDVEDGCRGHYCGARADIGGVSFKRATRKP